MKTVLVAGSEYHRIDVVVDRYRDETIKDTTRTRRSKAARTIRRRIDDRDVPLKRNWSNFLSLADNKADLAHFWSEELCSQAPVDKEIVFAGGFRDELEVKSSTGATDLGPLMKSGTSKKRLHIPVNAVFNKLTRGSAASFHAFTVCHTTSYIANHTKRSPWKIFKEHHGFLKNLGIGELTEETLKYSETFLTEETLKYSETFVCRIYNVYRTDYIDAARLLVFSKTGSQKQSPQQVMRSVFT